MISTPSDSQESAEIVWFISMICALYPVAFVVPWLTENASLTTEALRNIYPALMLLLVLLTAEFQMLLQRWRGTILRTGMLEALKQLALVRGYHFLIGYEDADGKGVARSLASVLSRSGASVWLDVYRLENAYLQQSVYHAAGRSAFVVLVVTPRTWAARTVARRCWRRCDVGLSTCWRGLTRAPSGTSASTIGSAGFCRRSSFASVTPRLDVLVQALDEVFMSRDEYHAEWWRQQPVVAETGICERGGHYCVKMRATKHPRLSLCGRLYVPAWRRLERPAHALGRWP